MEVVAASEEAVAGDEEGPSVSAKGSERWGGVEGGECGEGGKWKWEGVCK